LTNIKAKNLAHYETLSKILAKKKKKPNNYFEEQVKGFSAQGIDLLHKMLKIDP